MRYAAELFGTFVLVFAGLTAAVIAGGQIGNIGVAFAFGLSLMAMAFTMGPVSGCHINPAVTFGMLLARRISFTETLGYWVAQVIGATLGAGAVLTIASGGSGGYAKGIAGLTGAINGYGVHSPGGYSLMTCFIAEALLTMLLVVTVLGATDKRAPAGFAGIPIGLILTAAILGGIPITNASINPARSIGPAIYVGGWALQQVWLFIVAPLVGGALAAGVYATVKEPAAAAKGAAA
jgi:aquaporin Z